MKRLAFLLSAIVLFAGCSKIEKLESPLDNQTEVVTPGKELPEVIYANVADEEDTTDTQTRTFVGNDGKTILWHKNDAISYFTSNIHAKYMYQGEDGATSAEFNSVETFSDSESLTPVDGTYAVYPYDSDNPFRFFPSEGYVRVCYPNEQFYAVNSFGKGANIMLAASNESNDEDLFFKNACGYLVIKLYREDKTKIQSIKLTSLSADVKIAGYANIQVGSDAVPEISLIDTLSSTDLTLDCSNGGVGVELGTDAEHATEFWFALPPVTLDGGIKITVTDSEGNVFEKETTKSVTIPRNKIQPMAALQFVINAPSPNQLWYSTSDGVTKAEFGSNTPFDAEIVSHEKKGDRFVITFKTPLKKINNAFEGNEHLTSVDLPDGLEEISYSAFEGCSGLKSLTIPGSVNVINKRAFRECELKSLIIKQSPTKTPLTIYEYGYGENDYAPFLHSRLEYFYINREIDYRDVKGYKQSSAPLFASPPEYDGTCTIVIGKDIKTIQASLFSSLNVVEIVIPNWVTSIGWAAFLECEKLSSVTIPNSVTKISGSAFWGCKSLKELTIPGSVNHIGFSAFYNCAGLQSVTFLPSQDTLTISQSYSHAFSTNDYGPFIDTQLQTINLDRELKYVDSDGEVFTPTSTSQGLFVTSNNSLENINLGENVRTIGEYMFSSAEKLKSITIPGTVTFIGEAAFSGCINLEEIIFENGSEDLRVDYMIEGVYNRGPFYNSTNLKRIVMDRDIKHTTDPTYWREGFFATARWEYADAEIDNITVELGDHITTLPKFMLAKTPITSIVIPANVTHIKNNVFEECERLSTIRFNNSETPLHIGFQDNVDEVGPFYNSPLTEVYLDRELICDYIESLDQWDEGIFVTSAGLLSNVYLGASVKTIYDYMFYSAPISTISIPNGVKSIGKGAFSYNSALTSLTIPNSVTTIGESAFHSNETLTSLTIPSSVTSIGTDAFHGCSGLTSITFESGTGQLSIGPSTEGTGDWGPFYDSKNLTTVKLDRKLVPTYDIDGNEEGFFSELPKLNSVMLGSNVTTIHDYMFAASGITSITIPSSVTLIKDFAFNDCTALQSITFAEGDTDLAIGFQPHTLDEKGPFFDSPLRTINLSRNLVLTSEYAEAQSEWDEGIFAYTYWNEYDADDPANNWYTNLSIGPQVKQISNYMFSGVRLYQFWIPQEVKSIGYKAFHDCEQLRGVTLGHTSPPTLGKEVFDDCDKLSYIAIKKGTKASYMAATNWKNLSGDLFQETVN